jgi:hypothetical protein
VYAGADAVGLVGAIGPRMLDDRTIAAITSAVPPPIATLPPSRLLKALLSTCARVDLRCKSSRISRLQSPRNSRGCYRRRDGYK